MVTVARTPHHYKLSRHCFDHAAEALTGNFGITVGGDSLRQKRCVRLVGDLLLLGSESGAQEHCIVLDGAQITQTSLKIVVASMCSDQVTICFCSTEEACQWNTSLQAATKLHKNPEVEPFLRNIRVAADREQLKLHVTEFLVAKANLNVLELECEMLCKSLSNNISVLKELEAKQAQKDDMSLQLQSAIAESDMNRKKLMASQSSAQMWQQKAFVALAQCKQRVEKHQVTELGSGNQVDDFGVESLDSRDQI